MWKFFFKFNQGTCPWMAFAWNFFGIFLFKKLRVSVRQIIYRKYIVFRSSSTPCSLATTSHWSRSDLFLWTWLATWARSFKKYRRQDRLGAGKEKHSPCTASARSSSGSSMEESRGSWKRHGSRGSGSWRRKVLTREVTSCTPRPSSPSPRSTWICTRWCTEGLAVKVTISLFNPPNQYPSIPPWNLHLHPVCPFQKQSFLRV